MDGERTLLSIPWELTKVCCVAFRHRQSIGKMLLDILVAVFGLLKAPSDMPAAIQLILLKPVVALAADPAYVSQHFWSRATSIYWWDPLVMKTWDNQQWIQNLLHKDP